MNENIDHRQLYETIERLQQVINQIRDIFMNIWNQIREILDSPISIRTNIHKKGKRYVHNYKRISLFDYIRRYLI